MRNLKIVALEEIDVCDDANGLPLSATAWDANNDSIICAFGPTEAKPVIELKRRTPLKRSLIEKEPRLSAITSWDAPCPLPDLSCDEILLLQYFPDISTACLVLAGGDLIVVREEAQPGQEKIEIVGSVDIGITAAAWAPDEELLAIVTQADTLILMSRDFEAVNEATLSADDLKASKHVSVGWGKKETQFQGKRAKALRDPTVPETVDEGKLSQRDNGKASISWRGDGAFLAINNIITNHRRVVRVFTREGVLDSASEPVDGLESALSWKPSGNLIAGVQRLKDRIDVVFFERNGLRHGEFTLRLSHDEMDAWGSAISLSWNNDSSIVAVSFLDRVQFWTMGNYHYYLKQEFVVSRNETSQIPLHVRWHSEKAMRCCLHSTVTLEHAFTMSRGSVVEPDDHGIVVVIDGKTLKLTPFKHAAVPPPMAFCEAITKTNIIDCSISKSGRYLAILTVGQVEIFEWAFEPSATGKKADTNLPGPPRKMRPTSVLNRISEFSLAGQQSSPNWLRYTQIAFLGDKEVLFLAPSTSKSRGLIRSFQMEQETASTCNGGDLPPLSEREFLLELPQNLVIDVEQTMIWAQTPSLTVVVGRETYYNESQDLPNPTLPTASPGAVSFRVPNSCGICAENGSDRYEGSRQAEECHHFHQVSLSRRGDLLADSELIARGCTSFLVTNTYIVFTTSQHLLKFVHLTEPKDMEVPSDTPELDERCRSIERGARLVTTVPSSYSVVLQMPRGNLETIYPRVLVLSGIRQHILRGDYRSAFLACQTHQVDMNILHDYRPDLFMSQIGLFISQLKKISRIDDFLSKLKDEDVTQTLYKDTLKSSHASNGHAKEADSQSNGLKDKVNQICNAFLDVLSSRSANHLQNIITAHVCKRPPDLSTALTLISDLRQTSASDAESAISHLCFLTDSNRLYDTALSLYDLEITLLVAQNSQRDPREYLPFLQSLHALPPLRRYYQIDNHLRNYPKALTSLHALAAHDEVQSYTQKHTLYTHAMTLYKYSPTHLRTISTLYAAHLALTSHHAAAATLYESLSDYTSASPLHALAHHWRESLTCASLIPLPPDQLRSHALSLATTLSEESRDYRAAATIHTDYLADVPTAAKLLCRGSYFAEASRVLSRSPNANLIAEIIDTGLSDKFSEILELLSDCTSQIAAQVPRILELRQKKLDDPLAFFGGDPTLIDPNATTTLDVPDNISLAPTDASTTAGKSLFTRYGSHAAAGTVVTTKTHQTSKTKRREERKRARGKKGSVYEEEYLVSSVMRLVERLNGVQEEVGRLVDALVGRSLEGREKAAVVSGRMAEVVARCREGVRKIWGEDVEKEVRMGERPSGADGVLWESMEGLEEGATKRPELKAWKGSLVLDG